MYFSGVYANIFWPVSSSYTPESASESSSLSSIFSVFFPPSDGSEPWELLISRQYMYGQSSASSCFPKVQNALRRLPSLMFYDSLNELYSDPNT